MKILVLNCGSSSVKYKLMDMTDERVITSGGIERIGLDGSFLKFKDKDDNKVIIEKPLPEHTAAVELILQTLVDPKYAYLKSFDEIEAVGHRLVHGGETFSQSTIITDEVVAELKRLSELAPLHNPANIKGIEAINKLMPSVPQIGVFDTAFHQTMPASSYMYALPYRFYEDYKVRKYGFHGTSHRYVSHRACEILGRDIKDTKIITCHIGNGASMSAILNGKVIDTTMGFTPLEGLMMGTRSGDVDPGCLFYIMKKEGLSPEQVNLMVNKESGVLGIFGKSSDMRDLEDGVAAGDERAILAMDMYNYRIRKQVGAYLAALNGADIIIFTGGVGENQAITREVACTDMDYAGIVFDKELNNQVRAKEVILSKPESKTTVMIVPTDEELLIARDTRDLLSK